MIINWLDTHSGFILGLLTFAYVLATIMIYIANNKAVKEMRLSRIEESRPYVFASFGIDQRKMVELIIKNSGKTMARDVYITTEPELKYPKEPDYPLAKSGLINEMIPCLYPGQEIRAFFAAEWEVKEENGKRPKFIFNVQYKDSLGKGNTYSEKYIYDFNIVNGVVTAPQKTVHELVKEVEKLRKEFEKTSKYLKPLAQKSTNES